MPCAARPVHAEIEFHMALIRSSSADKIIVDRRKPHRNSDVARAVRYLIDARAVTGQMIAVDGGQHLIWKTADVGVE